MWSKCVWIAVVYSYKLFFSSEGLCNDWQRCHYLSVWFRDVHKHNAGGVVKQTCLSPLSGVIKQGAVFGQW